MAAAGQAWWFRVLLRAEAAKSQLAPVSPWARGTAGGDDGGSWGFLWKPAVLGLVALTAIAAGASLPSSPFKLEMAGTWFFGVPSTVDGPAVQANLLVGLVAVYGGLVLLARVWFKLLRALSERPGVPVRYLGMILALWLVPMLLVPPVFSRDVFSYAAQGEMMSRHINPYVYGPGTLGSGPFVNPVDPLWMNTPAPYGPLFLMIDGFFATLSFHNELLTVVMLRLLALGGTLLVAWCVPKLAEASGRDVGPVYVMAVLNPLVLLTLVGAAHNDALMVGLLVAGVTAAKRGRPVAGIVLCALAAAVKAPAALGVLYIGWEWLGPGLPLRQRVRPVLTAGMLAAGVMVLVTMVSGLGFGWVANLETPGTVRSWLAPATGAGLALSGLAHVVGVGVSQAGMLSVTRVLGLLTASAVAVYLLVRSERVGSLRSMGLSLLLFVILGPVVQPWYLTWGIVVLAAVASGRLRAVLVLFSVAVPFIGLTGGHTLLHQMATSDPLAVMAASIVLLAVALVPLGRWGVATRVRRAAAEAEEAEEAWSQPALAFE